MTPHPERPLHRPDKKSSILNFIRDRLSGEKNALPEIANQHVYQEEEKKLRDGIVLYSEAFRQNSNMNDIKLLHFLTGGKAIYKPQSGEKFLNDIGNQFRGGIKYGSFYCRERAAYVVSEIVGFHIVPPTVIRSFEGRIGSVQQFIENSMSYSPAMPIEPHYEEHKKMYAPALYKRSILDIMIWNSDAGFGNAMVKRGTAYTKMNPEDYWMWSIDHGMSFNGEEKIWPDAYRDPVAPKDVIETLETNVTQEKMDELRAELSPLLSEFEIENCIKRIKTVRDVLVDTGKLDFGMKEGEQLRVGFDGQPTIEEYKPEYPPRKKKFWEFLER